MKLIGIKKGIISIFLLLIFDFLYIGFNLPAYENQIASVQRVVMKIKPIGAIICYIAMVFGLNYFIIQPERPVLDAFLLGLVIYTVYASTNYATIKKWDPTLAVMDSLWGGILFALTTYVTYWLIS